MRNLLTIFLFLLLISCYPSYTESEIDEYLKLYLDGLNAGIYKPEGLFYSRSFERKLEDEKWEKTIEKIWKQFGSIESTELLSLSTNRLIAGKFSGVEYSAHYRIERETDTTYEVIGIFESNESKKILEITNHSIMTIVKF